MTSSFPNSPIIAVESRTLFGEMRPLRVSSSRSMSAIDSTSQGEIMLRTQLVLIVSAVVAATMLGACGASQAERRDWPMFTTVAGFQAPSYAGGQMWRSFGKPCPIVIKAGHQALSASSLSLESEEAIDSYTHAIYAEAGPFMLRQGEVARILFRSPESGNECQVGIRVEAKMSGNVLKKSTQEYANEYFTALEGHLKGSEMEDKYGSAE